METVNMVVCGLGGQGILFMTRVLAEAALHRGIRILGAETHGMAQRGGSVISHLRMGEVESSLVREGTAGFLLALDKDEAYRNLPFLAPGGCLYVNARKGSFPRQEVTGYLREKGIVSRAVPAGELAMALGSPLASNLALLGFFSAFQEGPFSYPELRETIDRISPDRFKEKNFLVFDAGHERGKGEGDPRG